MAFAEQFELLELLHRDKAETWAAIEKASNRRLLLHKFREDTGLRERLLSMAPADLIMLVSAEKEGDSYIVVTHDHLPLRKFAKWVESRSNPSDSQETVLLKPQPEQPAPSDPDRTQIIKTRSGGSGPTDPIESWFEPPSREASTARFGNSPTGEQGKEPDASPGEFTRLFQTPNVDSWHTSSGSLDSYQPLSPKAPDRQSGEFTRAFQSFGSDFETPPPVPAPEQPHFNVPRSEPGDFTRAFSPPREEGPAQALPSSFPDEAPLKPARSQAGEFTRMFNSPFASTSEPATEYPPPTPTPRAEPKPATGEFSRSLGSPFIEPAAPQKGSEASGIFSGPKHAPVPASEPAVPAGPSEYTVVIRSSPSAQPPAPATAPAAAPQAAEDKPATAHRVDGKRLITLVIILAVLAIIAVAILLYFLLRR